MKHKHLLPQPASNFPNDLRMCSSESLHEWKAYWEQERDRFIKGEPDKAYICQGNLGRCEMELYTRQP